MHKIEHFTLQIDMLDKKFIFVLKFGYGEAIFCEICALTMLMQDN